MAGDEICFSYDVVVVGSGAAGLMAALTAGVEGKEVILVEVTDTVGGTSISSGGQVWVPNHHRLDETDITDSPREALDYLRACSPNRNTPNDEERQETFVENAPRMLKFIEAHTRLRFEPNGYPDVFASWPGGKPGGRNVEAVPWRPGSISGKRGYVRKPPSINRLDLPLTWEEVHHVLDKPFRGMAALLPTAIWRVMQGKVSGAPALIAGLFAGCVNHGVDFALRTRARELVVTDGVVTGLEVEREGKSVRIEARCGVILASGGFDWSDELKRRHLDGGIEFPACIPSNKGDGLEMVRRVDAKVEHLDEAWFWAGFRDDKYFYEGAPLGSLASNLRSFPHTVIVNRQGRRFGNETTLNFGYHMQEKDEQGELPNLPCWVVFDHQFRRHYNAMEAWIHPLFPLPKSVRKYRDLEALCADLGIDFEGLNRTLAEFNQGAREGRDPAFGRGEEVYDRCYGSPSAPHPNLGTVERAPFYTMELVTTSLSTKGGPAVNRFSQVLHEDGHVIPNLYAVGNVADCIMYFGCSGGDSLGPGMTAGYVAALTLGKGDSA